MREFIKIYAGIIMKLIIFYALMLLASLLHAQERLPEEKEFEGTIMYVHSFEIPDGVMDSIEAVKAFGASSLYSYKKGYHRWDIEGCIVEYELFIPSQDLLVDKYNDADTLKRIESRYVTDSLVSWELEENADTVLGEICHVLRMEVILNGTILKRKISYSPKYYVDPAHYKNFRFMRSDFMYEKIRSVPLKLEMDFERSSIKIIMTAQKITPSQIQDSIFEIKLPYSPQLDALE